MFVKERQQKILEILNENKSIRVDKVAKLLNVSECTIRRDLKELEQNKLLERTHGGAIIPDRTSFEPSFYDKEKEKSKEKVLIGKYAANMIKENDTVILDSGTTTLEIARNIHSENITVITNSVNIAHELCNKKGIELIVTGGNLRPKTRAMVGPITEEMLKKFRVDKAFIGANGISIKDGITTPNFIEAQTKKTMIDVSNEVIVVADSSKFNKRSFAIVESLEKIDSIVTTNDIDNDIFVQYENLGVNIITV